MLFKTRIFSSISSSSLSSSTFRFLFATPISLSIHHTGKDGAAQCIVGKSTKIRKVKVIMAAIVDKVVLKEDDISGAKLTKDVSELNKDEAKKWLQFRVCRNSSHLTLKQLKDKINLYILNGWDEKCLKDPDGVFCEQKRVESLSKQRKTLENILDGKVKEHSWKTSLNEIPTITHSVVEKYFELAEGKRPLKEGYAFSKTEEFETSGKLLRIDLLPEQNNMFMIEGYTRPAMKQAKRNSSTSVDGLYRCCIIFDKTTGEILAGRDFSCPAGKRRFCKHVAALAYKLVEATMSSKSEMP